MAELFKTERKDITAKKEKREISEMKEQLAKKDSIIAELAGENMALKKKLLWLDIGKIKASLELRTLIAGEVEKLSRKTGIRIALLLSSVGISRSNTDFSYIRIGGKFYYFSAVLDGFSRKILVWDLFEDMKEFNVELLVTKAKELYPNEKPRIIHDNEKIERFHRTLKTEHVRRTSYVSASYAEIKIAEWICWYNSERLNGAIFYLTPDEVFYGKMEERLVERKNKLYNASIKRQEFWKNQHDIQSA